MNRESPHSLPFTMQMVHQLRIEWLHHRLWVLGYLVLITLRLFYRLDPWWQTDMRIWGEPLWLWLLAIIAPVVVTIRVILADPPASTDLGTHTRPVSRWSLWTAKMCFLLGVIVLPWLLADAWLWSGLGHSWGSLLSLVAASLLTILLLVLSGAAVAGTATSGAQLTVAGFSLFILFFAAQTGINQVSIWAGWNDLLWYSHASKLGYPSAWMTALPWLVTSLLALGAWLLVIHRRWRWAALSMLAVAALLIAGAQAWQIMGWSLADEIPYAGPPLELKLGKQADGAQTSMQSLWPTLHVDGLPANHLASIVSFMPPELDWRKFRQNPENKNEPTYWMDNEAFFKMRRMAEVVAEDGRKMDLWFHSAYLDTPRDPLTRVIGPVLPTAPWRLRLAIYEVRPILNVPLSALAQGPKSVILSGGQQVEIAPLDDQGSSLRVKWRWRNQHSVLIPESAAKFRPGRTGGLGVLGYLAVVQDEKAHENFLLIGGGGSGDVARGFVWIEDTTYEEVFHISKPLAEMQLTGLKLEDWIQQARLQIWLAEDRGIADMDVSPAQMKQVLEMP